MIWLPPGEIRARRRPFVILAIALSRLVAGLCLALPLASLLAESRVGQRAEGDRALFEGGGYLLLEILRLHGPAAVAALRGLLPVLGAGLLLTAFCNAALLVALSAQGRLRLAAWWGAAAVRVPALVVIAVATTLGQGLSLLLFALLAGGVPEPLTRPQQTTALQLALWLVALLGAGALGGFGDVIKAVLVRHETTLAVAVGRAWRAARQRPTFTLLGWLPFAVPLAASVLGAAWLTEMVDVGRPGGWRVAAVLTLHQSVIVVAVACRAAWYAAALRGACAVQ